MTKLKRHAASQYRILRTQAERLQVNGRDSSASSVIAIAKTFNRL